MGQFRDSYHPAFRRGKGLGDVPGRVWYRLCEAGPSSPADIARAVGSTRKSVHPALTRLISYGLAERRSHGVYAATGTGEDLDRIALDLGVYDRMEQQAKSHRIERDQWGAEKARWRCPVLLGDRVCGAWKHRDQPDCGRHTLEPGPDYEPADEEQRRAVDEALMSELGIMPTRRIY